MNINELIERFSKIPIAQRVGGLAGACVVMAGLFWFLFYSDASDESDRLDKQVTQLLLEKGKYEEKRQRYKAFRAEVNKLLEEQRELVKVLPTETEFPQFLESIHSQAEQSGLNILSFTQQREKKSGFYATIPVNMSVRGSYHQIMKFFYSVGQLKRIVNIKNLRLGTRQNSEMGVNLQAGFVANTFRFIELPATAPAAGKKPNG